jgi:hypothetical protein
MAFLSAKQPLREIPPRPKRFVQRERFVYFVRGEGTGLIKIGLANDAWRRLNDLRIGSPDKLELA